MSIVSAVVAVTACIWMKKSLLIGTDVIPIIIASLLGPCIGALLYVYLISKTDELPVVITLAFTSPLFALLINHYFLKEKISIRQIIGILAVVSGVILLIKKPNTSALGKVK